MTSLFLRRKKNASGSKTLTASQLDSEVPNNVDLVSTSPPASDINGDTVDPDPLCANSSSDNNLNKTGNINTNTLKDFENVEENHQEIHEPSTVSISNSFKLKLDEDSEPPASPNTPQSEDSNNLNESTSLKKQSPLDSVPPQSSIRRNSLATPKLGAIASDSALLSKKNSKSNRKKRIFSASRKPSSSKEKNVTKTIMDDKKNTNSHSSSTGTSYFSDSIVGSLFLSSNNNATSSEQPKKSEELSTSKRSSSDLKGSKNSIKKSLHSTLPTSVPLSHSSRFSSVFSRDKRQSSSTSVASQNHSTSSTIKEENSSRKSSKWNILSKRHDSAFSSLKKKSEATPRASSSIGYSTMPNNHSNLSLNTHVSYSNRPSVDGIHSVSSSPNSRRNSVNLLTPPSRLFPRSASSRSLNVDQQSVSSSTDLDNTNQSTNTSSRLFDSFFKYPFHKNSPSASPKPKATNAVENTDTGQKKALDIPELTLSTTNNDLQPVLEFDSSSSSLSPKSTIHDNLTQEASTKSNVLESNSQVNDKQLKNSHSLFSFATNFISEHSTSSTNTTNNSSTEPQSSQQDTPIPNTLSPDASNATSITSSFKAPLSRIRKMTASVLFNTDHSDVHNPTLNRSENSLPQTPSSEILFSIFNNNQDSNSSAKSDSEIDNASKDMKKESPVNILDTQGNSRASVPLSRTLSSQSPLRENSEADDSHSLGFASLLASRPRSRTWSSLEQKPTSHFSLFSTKHSESSLTSLSHRQNNSNTENNTRYINNNNISLNTPNSPRASLNTPTDPFNVQLPPIDEGETPATYLSKVRALGLGSNTAGVLAKIDDEFHRNVLRLYVMGFHFHNDPLDMALRKFLISVKLPRETQQIDRVLEAFAFRYHECNPEIYERPEDAYFVVFSLVLLHTDFFNPNNKMKMQKTDYLKIKSEKDHQSIAEEILSVSFSIF